MKAAYVALVALGTIPGVGLAQRSVPYTAGQAAAGRSAYAEHCAECHLETMVGSFEAPELAGPNFLNFWGGRSVGELLEVTITMPPDEEESLGDEVYASIVAYILRQNGFPSGPQVLAMSAQNPLDGGTGQDEAIIDRGRRRGIGDEVEAETRAPFIGRATQRHAVGPQDSPSQRTQRGPLPGVDDLLAAATFNGAVEPVGRIIATLRPARRPMATSAP